MLKKLLQKLFPEIFVIEPDWDHNMIDEWAKLCAVDVAGLSTAEKRKKIIEKISKPHFYELAPRQPDALDEKIESFNKKNEGKYPPLKPEDLKPHKSFQQIHEEIRINLVKSLNEVGDGRTVYNGSELDYGREGSINISFNVTIKLLPEESCN